MNPFDFRGTSGGEIRLGRVFESSRQSQRRLRDRELLRAADFFVLFLELFFELFAAVFFLGAALERVDFPFARPALGPRLGFGADGAGAAGAAGRSVMVISSSVSSKTPSSLSSP